jgi:hypothetical protein
MNTMRIPERGLAPGVNAQSPPTQVQWTGRFRSCVRRVLLRSISCATPGLLTIGMLLFNQVAPGATLAFTNNSTCDVNLGYRPWYLVRGDTFECWYNDCIGHPDALCRITVPHGGTLNILLDDTKDLDFCKNLSPKKHQLDHIDIFDLLTGKKFAIQMSDFNSNIEIEVNCAGIVPPTPETIDDKNDNGCKSGDCCNATSSSDGSESDPSTGSAPCPDCAQGMPRWSVSEPYVSLWLKDEPLGYQPALGPRVSVHLSYKQRETTSGSYPSLFSVGKRWNFSW